MRHSPELNCQLFSSNFIKLGIQCDMRYELLRRPCHPRPRPWARSECQDRDQDITDQDQDRYQDQEQDHNLINVNITG